MKTEPLVLFHLLVLSFACGFFLAFGRGLILFFCRIFTKLIKRREDSRKSNTVLQMLQDVLFCLAVGLTLAILLFYYSEGRIRAFSVLSLFAGVLLYRIGIEKPFSHFSVLASDKIACFILCLASLLTRPLVRLWFCLCKWAAKPFVAYGKRMRERRLQRYQKARMEQLRTLSKKGFINIEWTT